MYVSRLNDAAIALCNALRDVNVDHGIFGGYAVGVLGGSRDSKDIDCLAIAAKEQVISILEGVSSFSIIPQIRKDHVALLWRRSGSSASGCGEQLPVSIKIFLVDIPRLGAYNSTKDIPIQQLEVYSQLSRPGKVSILDPVAIFRGKLAVAASRNMRSDAIDLYWLASQYRNVLRERSTEFSPLDLSSVCASHPKLFRIFRDLGADYSQLFEQQYLVDRNDMRLSGPTADQVQRVLIERSEVATTKIALTTNTTETRTIRSVCMAYSGHDKT